MRLSDLFRLAFSNLRRRKTRTLLTVLGVVIGTASIVVMISLGLGMSESMVREYQQYGSLTKITIYANNYGNSGNQPELTDEAVNSLGKLAHVKGVSPVLSVYVNARCGAYTASFSINGLSQYGLSQLELASGSLPQPNQKTLSLVYGNMIRANFYKSGDYTKPGEVDPMKDVIFFTFPEGSSASSSSSSSDSSAQKKPAKKYILEASGELAGGTESYSEGAYSCYADIDTLKTFLKKIYKKNLVPEPHTSKNGKPLRYYVYDEAYVYVDEMDNVSGVQKQITDLGYTCYSNMEGLETAQNTMRMVQLVLGGIGAVSLLVAAIGIMNTMMMSIYERTREIGVMKVLGCDMGDIRNMFLAESAMIGFFGGAAGLIFSLAVSQLVNFFSRNGSVMLIFFGMAGGGSISVIPPWLAGFAIVFAVLVGMLSGYFPSVRAMKLSPLAAIRNEG